MRVDNYSISELPRGEVLRYLGYRGQELTPEVEERIDEGIAHMLEIAKPKAAWGIFSFAQPDDSGAIRLLGSSLELPGSSIVRHLDGAVSCYVLAVTVGMDVDRELKRLSATDPVAEVILDACGTVAVEQAAALCQKSIAKNAALGGFYANARFSPGYGDLPLSVQPALLATLNAQRYLGITLTKSLLMIPTKSITAIMGEFPDAPRARSAERASGSLD